MNLSVQTHWPSKMPGHLVGKPTEFRKRILNSLAMQYPIWKRTAAALPDLYLTKPHTIRKGKRWRPGMLIHFFEWTGKPYRSPHFKFAPKVTCVSTQEIDIIWTDPDKASLPQPLIFIDRVWICDEQQKLNLAINDGFDSLESFYAWFNQDFSGQIIHWTNLKYL